jgi:DNA-binding XRE family transcriptional regulator
MTDMPDNWPAGVKTANEILAEQLEADPEFAAEWRSLALSRMVARELIAYRADRGLGQRELAQLLGVKQPRVVELESGETDLRFKTLWKIVVATGIEFAFDLAPEGREPSLVRRDKGTHIEATGSVLVAAAD